MPLDDRNWVETKPEVFSLADLVAWLETQDPTTEYDYTDTSYCLVGQYTIARGGERVADSYIIGGRRLSSLAGGLLEAGLHAVAAGYRRGLPCRWPFDGTKTFGAALERARALLAKEKANGRNCG